MAEGTDRAGVPDGLDGAGLRVGVVRGPLERRHRRAARRRASRGASRRSASWPTTSSRCRCPGRSRSRSAARALAASGPGRRGDLPRRGDPGRDHPLRHRGRRVRRGRAAGPARHRRPGGVRRAHHRGRATRRWPGPRARAATTWARRPRSPRSRWPHRPALRRRLIRRSRLAPPAPTLDRRAEARPPQGLARAGHPRAVRGGRPHGPPVLRASTTRRRSTTPASTRCASCARRRSRSYVAEGLFDLGITGRDWVEETESRGRLPRRARTTRRPPRNPFRIVVAVPDDSPWDKVEDLPDGVRVSTEYPSSPGGSSPSAASTPTSASPTAPPRPRCPTSSTASSTSPRPAGRCGPRGSRSSTTILPSYTELIANPDGLRRPGQAPRHGAAQDAARRRARGPGQGAGEAQRRRGRPRPVIALRAVDEVADRVRAVRRGRLRGRDGRRQVGDQHADPRAQGRRRHRHHRAAALEDRPLIGHAGRSVHRGHGHGRHVRRGPRRSAPCASDGGECWAFHCTAIADGSRTIAGRGRPCGSASSPDGSAGGKPPGIVAL